MATTSLYSSTTHSTVGSRRGSRQIRHWSSSETLKQMLQNFTFALTSISTSASRRTSVGSACSRWNAIRCALLGPTPGSRPSSSMRSWTTPSYNADLLEAELPGGAASRQTTPGERTEGLAGERVGLRLGVPVGGDDHVAEVGEVVGVAAVEPAGLDLDADELAHAVDLDRDRPTGDGAVDDGVGQLGLRVGQLLLHLLGLLEQGVHVEAATTQRLERVLAHDPCLSSCVVTGAGSPRSSTRRAHARAARWR